MIIVNTYQPDCASMLMLWMPSTLNVHRQGHVLMKPRAASVNSRSCLIVFKALSPFHKNAWRSDVSSKIFQEKLVLILWINTLNSRFLTRLQNYIFYYSGGSRLANKEFLPWLLVWPDKFGLQSHVGLFSWIQQVLVECWNINWIDHDVRLRWYLHVVLELRS